MKKMLVMAIVAVMGFQAHAGNISLTEEDFGTPSTHNPINLDAGTGGDPAALDAKAQGEIGFILDIADQFLFKVFNNRMVNSGMRAVSQANPEDVIDLGEISGGIATATVCSDLVGLATVAQLGVSSGSDSETGVSISARGASCAIADVSSGARELRMRIPLNEVALKAGAKRLVVDYAIVQEAAVAFDRLALCDSTIVSNDLADYDDAAECEGTGSVGADHEVLDAATASGGVALTVELAATLQGAGAKSSYEGFIVATVGLEL